MFTIPAEAKTTDRIAVACHRVQAVACLWVPKPDRMVFSHTCQVPSIRAEGDAPNESLMSLKAEAFRMAQTLEVMPLPIPEMRRTLIQPLLGPRSLLIDPVALGKLNAMEIGEPIELVPQLGF